MCSGKLVKILLIIFSRFEEVFGKTVERMEVFRKSAEKAAKEEFEEKRASTESPPRMSREEKNAKINSSTQDRGMVAP